MPAMLPGDKAESSSRTAYCMAKTVAVTVTVFLGAMTVLLDVGGVAVSGRSL
jgi:hypothetical protein